MPRIPGINHIRAVRALKRAGYWVEREGKHITMTNGGDHLTIPRGNPIDAFTMGGIAKDAGLSVSEFKKLL